MPITTADCKKYLARTFNTKPMDWVRVSKRRNEDLITQTFAYTNPTLGVADKKVCSTEDQIIEQLSDRPTCPDAAKAVRILQPIPTERLSVPRDKYLIHVMLDTMERFGGTNRDPLIIVVICPQEFWETEASMLILKI